MATTTEVFAPGTPSLPEGLRTLVVSPDREVEPGALVEASFSFTNVGGAPATGLRARFSMPPGLGYVPGSARIDERVLEEIDGESPLLAGPGAEIGEVAPGVERRIAIAYRVAPTIENRTVIELQAALSSLEVPVIGSNVARLVVRSAPQLACPATALSFEAPRGATPGSEVLVRARVHNAGQSSAHDIVVIVPVPDHTSYVPRSARINGREMDDGARREPFGYANPAIAAPVLGPSTTLEVEYRVRIDSPLGHDTVVQTEAWVSSLETPEFALEPVSTIVNSPTSFEGNETRFEVEAADDVQPGQLVPILLRAQNAGTNDAHHVTALITLPPGLVYVPGSAALDDQPLGLVSEGSDEIAIETIAAGAVAIVRISAVVAAPAPNGRPLPVSAKLRWHSGSRDFERTLTVRSQPRFSRAHNYVERTGDPSAKPGGDVGFAVAIRNDGTAQAGDVRLYISADFGLTDLTVFDEDGTPLAQVERTVALGVIEPYEARRLTLRARIVEPISDRSELRLAATLSTPEIPDVDLGVATYTAVSRPRFTQAGCKFALIGDDAIRPERLATVLVRVTNDGTDGVRDASVLLKLSPEARLESVENAIRDGNSVVFGDIAAHGSREATLRLRLTRNVPSGTVITLEGWVCGVGIAPVLIEPAAIPTFSEPSFSEGAQFVSQPAESVDAGATLSYALNFRNGGDGAAEYLMARAYPSEFTTYVPGSTTINDVPLVDEGGRSQLWSASGLRLANLQPGVEAVVRWRSIVNTPLPVGTLIEAQASIEWDGNRRYDVVAPAVRVRSTPSFAVAASGLPFGVAGTLGSMHPAVQARSANDLHLAPPGPPPVARPIEPPHPQEFHVPPVLSEPAGLRQTALQAPLPAGSGPLLYADLSRERLERMLRLVDEAEFGGLITHIFAIRALLPDAVAGEPSISTRLEAVRGTLRDVLDPLFIKLRLPRYAITKRDLENREARTALAELVESLGPSVDGGEPPAQSEPVRLRGNYDRSYAAALAAVLAGAPLGSVVHWQVLVEFLGTSIDRFGESSDALGIYRGLLRSALADIAAMPATEFYRILTNSSNAALDEALRSVLSTLRQSLDVPA